MKIPRSGRLERLTNLGNGAWLESYYPDDQYEREPLFYVRQNVSAPGLTLPQVEKLRDALTELLEDQRRR